MSWLINTDGQDGKLYTQMAHRKNTRWWDGWGATASFFGDSRDTAKPLPMAERERENYGPPFTW